MAAQVLRALTGEEEKRMERVEIARIQVEKGRVRAQEEDEDFARLRASIAQNGLIEPIFVREGETGLWLVAGARRLEACRQLGWETIPAQVSACDACEALLLALCENLHRKALHYLDEAAGYKQALAEYGLTQEELSRRVGRSQSAIANKVRLLQLSAAEQQALRHSGLSERHARALLPLAGEAERLRLIELCAKQEWSVKRLEEWVAQEIARREAATGRRVLLLMRDQRLYINAIRDIVSQMKASGIHANMTMEDLGDRIEMRVVMPRGVRKR